MKEKIDKAEFIKIKTLCSLSTLSSVFAVHQDMQIKPPFWVG